jgi:hypothetical protein
MMEKQPIIEVHHEAITVRKIRYRNVKIRLKSYEFVVILFLFISFIFYLGYLGLFSGLKQFQV